MHPSALIVGLAAALLALASCGRSAPTYAPVTTTSADVDGRPAAFVAVPPDAPQGELQLMSLGVTRVSPPTDSRILPFDAIYLRMRVVNRSDEVWTLDQARQRIEIEEVGHWVTNAATTSTGARPPVVQVGPRKRAVVDLMFELPERRGGGPLQLNVLWTLRAGAREVAGRVPFQRHIDTAAKPPLPGTFYDPVPTPYDIPGRYPAPPARQRRTP